MIEQHPNQLRRRNTYPNKAHERARAKARWDCLGHHRAALACEFSGLAYQNAVSDAERRIAPNRQCRTIGRQNLSDSVSVVRKSKTVDSTVSRLFTTTYEHQPNAQSRLITLISV